MRERPEDLEDYIRCWAAAFGQRLTPEQALDQHQAEAELYEQLKASVPDKPGLGGALD